MDSGLFAQWIYLLEMTMDSYEVLCYVTLSYRGIQYG